MDPNPYPELRHSAYAYEGLGSPQSLAIDLDFEPYPLPNQNRRSLASHHVPTGDPPGILANQRTTTYNPAGFFTTRDDWYQHMTEHRRPLTLDRPHPMGIFSIQSQHGYPSHVERAVQTIQSSFMRENDNARERPQAQRPAPCGLVRQEPYKVVRRHTGFTGPMIIKFVVDGKEGVRLSDALEGNWAGFEGRDDSSLFEGDRPPIILRLQLIGCSPWHSKISTTDFTAKRQPITRTRLVAEVAKRMKKFIEREKSIGHDSGHPRCGWGEASLKNVFLNRMVRVSAASWQPEIRVE